MNNDIQIFKNDQFGEIRTSGTPEKPLFCLVDICKAMELSTVKKVKNRLRKDGVTSIHLTDSLGRSQDATFISEQNLYLLIMRSDKPQAQPFQDWVCGEVLPAIRKTGGYLGADGLTDDEIMAKALMVAQKTIERKAVENRQLKGENQVLRLENARLEGENVQLTAENQELRNDKNYLDLIMQSKALLTISQIAQDYGMSGKAMNKKLAEMGVQYSINGQWILYAKYKDCGYVSSRSIDITRSDGRPDVVLHTEWTQAGRKFLYELLKKNSIIPLIER